MRRRPTATARAETPSGGSPAGVSGGRAVNQARDDAGLVSGGLPRPSTLGLSLVAAEAVREVGRNMVYAAWRQQEGGTR
jgi:hypothetical protein